MAPGATPSPDAAVPPAGGARRILFHLGLPKTGTTSIQATLAANAARLADRMTIAAYDARTIPLRKPGQAYAQQGDDAALPDFRAALAGLRATIEAAPALVAIVSDENIHSRRVYTPRGHCFQWMGRALPVIAEAFDGHDLRFVFYTRAADPWLRSAWAQEVKRGRCRDDFAAWRRALPFAPDWRAQFDALAAVAGAPVTTLEMEPEAAEGRLGAGLLRRAGLSEAELDALDWSPPRNAALPGGALEFMRRVNASDLPYRMVLRVSDLVEASRDMFVSEGDAVMTRPALQHEELQDG